MLFYNAVYLEHVVPKLPCDAQKTKKGTFWKGKKGAWLGNILGLAFNTIQVGPKVFADIFVAGNHWADLDKISLLYFTEGI